MICPIMKSMRTIIAVALAVMLTACSSFASTPAIPPTEVKETAMPTLTPPVTPLPTTTPLPPTPPTSLPVSLLPTTVALEDGLEWVECVVPAREYAHNNADLELLSQCVAIPTLDENDKNRMGERLEGQRGLTELRITIGSDHFETRLADLSQGCCSYELIRNGDVLLKMTPGFMTSDPNRNFWNIGGKLVWELGGYTAVIVVDGVDFNEKYQLEGSFFPYEIHGKLIYIAKKDAKYHIVFDEKVMGIEFDQIYMAFCCGMISVYYGQGQYWFVGRRAGTYYVVRIQ